MVDNKNTKLIYDYCGDGRMIFPHEFGKLNGVGFETTVDGCRYRCAVKVPKSSIDHKTLHKIWSILMVMLKDPSNPACNAAVEGETLTGKEISVEDYDSFMKMVKLER